jgi:glucose/arabinose dehydrogenase
MRFLVAPALAFAVAVPPATAEITGAPAVKSANLVLKVETKATKLYHPWGLAFLPDGRLLLTERAGRLRILGANGKLSKPLQGVPAVFTSEQGGLLDVALAPDFAASGSIYFSYAEPRGGRRSNGTSVARARLALEGDGGRLQDLRVIFRQEPSYTGYLAFGSRLLVMPDGSLFITLGDRVDLEEEAQNPANHLGKLVRVLPDGGPHPDNPKLGGWRPEIWSIGHRNMQGIALHPANGRVWTVEHGARGGDELNVPLAGKNYGWPVISYGANYDGSKIGEGTRKPGLEQPVYYWDPSIAPSSAVFYTGDLFPEWKGDLLVTALAGEALHRLVLDGEKVVGEEIMLKELDSRLRNVRQGPDGAIWLLTDHPEAMVLRMVPSPTGGCPTKDAFFIPASQGC